MRKLSLTFQLKKEDTFGFILSFLLDIDVNASNNMRGRLNLSICIHTVNVHVWVYGALYCTLPCKQMSLLATYTAGVPHST